MIADVKDAELTMSKFRPHIELHKITRKPGDSPSFSIPKIVYVSEDISSLVLVPPSSNKPCSLVPKNPWKGLISCAVEG